MADEKQQPAQNTAPATDAGGTGKADNPAATGASSADASAVETIKNTAKDVLDKAKDSAGDVYGVVSEKAESQITEQKANLSSGLSGVADTIRRFGSDLRNKDSEQNMVGDITAKYGDTLAVQVERVADYFDRKDLREIVSDVETFARRQPTVFVGAAFVAGILAARFLKSSDAQSSGNPRMNENQSRQKSDGENKTKNQNNPGGQTALGAS